MVNIGLISDMTDIYGTYYLTSENTHLDNSHITSDQWSNLIDVCNHLYLVWTNYIGNEDWNSLPYDENNYKIMKRIRRISKYSTKMENYQYYTILTLNRSFDDIIHDLKTLTIELEKLYSIDGNRLKKAYYLRKGSSDQKPIISGLNYIKNFTSKSKDDFDYKDFIEYFLRLMGIGINLFLLKYIKFTSREDILP